MDITGLHWCVKSRDGWCATKVNRQPPEGATSVATLCQHFVVLPGGYERREPTCRDCIKVMRISVRRLPPKWVQPSRGTSARRSQAIHRGH
jgi:hypothetical protein